MDARQAFYEFMLGLVNMIWTARYLVGPFLLMLLVLRFVRWSWASGRGERDYDELAQAYTEQSEELHNRVAGYRQARYLRGLGFTKEQIRLYRGQRHGGRHRW